MDIKAGHTSNNKSSLDSEKSLTEKIELEIKHIIFGVLFTLLKEEETSKLFAIIISFCMFLQLLIFPFNPNIAGIWKNEDVVDIIKSVSQVVQINYWFKTTSWSLYIAIFYLCIVILIFVILNIFYVSYAFNRKKFNFMWPIYTLKIFLSFFINIAFYPFLDLFMSMMNCNQNKYKVLSHAEFTDIECWSGIHILHSSFAILISIVFCQITLVVSLCYYESKHSANVPKAMTKARANFFLLIYMIVMIICFTFFNGEDYHYILQIFMLSGSLVLFFKFHFYTPYYDEVITKLWSCIVSVNLWTVVMQCFAKFLEGKLFEGSIIVWMIGIPFIILIVLTNRDHRVDYLLVGINKFQSGDGLNNQFNYILKLISQQSSDKSAAILQDGYMELHKQTCSKDDCPLKQKNNKSTSIQKNMNFHSDEFLNEKYRLLIQLLNRMYCYGIKKFPNNTSIRISFAFFLIEKLNLKQQALQELTYAEQSKPPFDEHFIIFRYRKIIEDEISESKNEESGNLDIVTEISFQNEQRQCHAGIEKSSMHHMEFWSQLSEDNPDLAKLNEIGSKIHLSVDAVEEHMYKLQRISPNMPKALKLFGKFLTDIINDKELGEEYLQKARNLTNLNNNKKTTMMNFNGSDEIGENSTATILISGDPEKLGIISNVNIACSSLFHYNKSELMNRNVKTLMSHIYAKNHDSFLENYLNVNEMNFMKKERQVYGKNKMGYIFPIFLNIKAVPSNYASLTFIGTIRTDKHYQLCATIIVQNDGTIDGISDDCISILGIDSKMIQRRFKIQEFFPMLMKDKETYLDKSGSKIEYKYPKDSEYVNNENTEKVDLNCFMSKLQFQGMEEPGYIIKFHQITDKDQNLKEQKKHKCKRSNFEFRPNQNNGGIIGEFKKRDNDELAGEGDGHSEEDSFDICNSFKLKNQDVNKVVVQKKDYGAGIKTLRLIDGKACEIVDNESDEEDDEDLNDGKCKGDNKNQICSHAEDEIEEDVDDFSLKMFNNIFKSRKTLSKVVSNDSTPTPVLKLNIVGHVVIIALCIMAVTDYFISEKEFKNISTNIDLLKMSYQRTSELQNIISKVQHLELLNKGIHAYDTTQYTQTQIEALWKQNITDSISSIETIQKSLQPESISISLSKQHKTLLTTNIVPMRHLENLVAYFDLNEATKQIITKAFNVKESTLSSIDSQSSDVYFIIHNSFNDYYMNLIQSSNYFLNEQKDRCDNGVMKFLILMLVSITIIIVGMFFLSIFLVEVNKVKEEILKLFLEIPEKNVKLLYTKCENFIGNLQVGEDDEALSDLDELSNQDNDQDDSTSENRMRKRRKKRRINSNNHKSIFPIVLSVSLIIAAYFGFNFYRSYDMFNDDSKMVKEINATTSAESFFYYVYNSQTQLYRDDVNSIVNRPPKEIVNENIKNIFELDSIIHEEHSKNIDIHNSNYKQIYSGIMMSDPCVRIESLSSDSVSEASCQAFSNQSLSQGLAQGLAHHYENLRYVLSIYKKYDADPDLVWSESSVTCPEVSGFSNQARNKLCLNLLVQTQEASTMQNVYVRYFFRELVAQIQRDIDDIYDKHKKSYLGFLVGLLCLLFQLYLVMWLPLTNRLKKDICKTRSMLSMIPLTVISNLKPLRMYIKKSMSKYNY